MLKKNLILTTALILLISILAICAVWAIYCRVQPSPEIVKADSSIQGALYVNDNRIIDCDGNAVYGYFLDSNGDVIDSDGHVVIPGVERKELSFIESAELDKNNELFILNGELASEQSNITTEPAEFLIRLKCAPTDADNQTVYLSIKGNGDVVFANELQTDNGRPVKLSASQGQVETMILAYQDGLFDLEVRNGMGELIEDLCLCVGAEVAAEDPCRGSHDFQETEVSPTLWTQGYILHVCEECGYAYKDTYTHASKHMHSWHVRAVIDPSYYAAGYTLEECNLCHQLRRSNPTPKIFCDHHEDVSLVIAPTCTEKGYTLHECALCWDFSWRDDFTPPTGHDMIETEIPANYEHGKMIVRMCKICEFEEAAQEVSEPLNCRHSQMGTERIKPTCTESGYTIHYCAKCGYTYTDSKTDALGHYFTAQVIEPTATEEGYTIYTCERCGYSYKDDYVSSQSD